MQVVQHNILSQFTQRQLKAITGNKSKSTEKLSSGYRINRAGDDAAGLSISEKMRWQIKGLDKASNNCLDGNSLMQVAEGALSEVHSMLDRMKELTVQAANDTNTPEDRQQIQKEINQLVMEIDRIGDTTEFNTKPLFKGEEVSVIDNSTGQIINASDIPISDFTIEQVELNQQPFNQRSSANTLNLGVVLRGDYNLTGAYYPLIYGNGSTSNTQFYYSFEKDGELLGESVALSNMTLTDFSHNGDTFSRTFSFSSSKYEGAEFSITQNVRIGANDGTQQAYSIDYDIVNNSPAEYANNKVMIYSNIDTAYGGNHIGDVDEDYFVNGSKVDSYTTYATISDLATMNQTYFRGTDTLEQLNQHILIEDWTRTTGPQSFSVFNLVHPELPFSEYINLNNAMLTSFSRYASGNNTLEDLIRSGGATGQTTERSDKTFSATWISSCNPGATVNIETMEVGIKKKTSDPNLAGQEINGITGKLHSNKLDLWIQSGATEKSGFFITVDEMNSDTLGINHMDVSSYESASDANARVDRATDQISSQRARLGAQMNRLERASAIDDNSSDNTQAAESRLRDTDMAKEMVQHSKSDIISQAAQSMLTQANQQPQGILTLLS